MGIALLSRKDLSYAHCSCRELLAAAGTSQQVPRLDFVLAVTIRIFIFLDGSAVLQRTRSLFQRNLQLFLSFKENARV
jgi:hypothetical protein